MKRLLIFLILIIFLLGIGAGAYYYVILLPQQQENIEEARKKTLPDEPLEYMSLSTITVPIIRKGLMRQYIIIEVYVELAQEMPLKTAEKYRPRLKDSFIRNLHRYFSQIPINSRLNLTVVRKNLLLAARKILGKENVEDILIESVYRRNIN